MAIIEDKTAQGILNLWTFWWFLVCEGHNAHARAQFLGKNYLSKE